MASKFDHLLFADQNREAAEGLLGSANPVSQRWGIVAAYYSVLHVSHAIAADHWNQHPEDHPAVWEIPVRVDSSQVLLKAALKELYDHSYKARYLKGGGAVANRWFEPLWLSAEDAVRRARELFETLDKELRRLGGF